MPSLSAMNLGKAYQLYTSPIHSLREWLRGRPQNEPFWALKDVSFSLQIGSSLGVIGDNGSGKSTLLKLLAGTISPSTGSVGRSGDVSSILELGSGFDPELSGRENIRIGCATLGLSPRETERRLDEVIAFSELNDFIERPVKTYSTGMSARLGFSVATCRDSEILVVDEVLSVGDQHFRRKALDRMMHLRNQGTSLVFCSHNLSEVEAVCDETIWLNKGTVEMSGKTSRVVESYRMREPSIDKRTAEAAPLTSRFGGDTFLAEVKLGGDYREGAIQTGGTLEIFVAARLTRESWKDGAAISIDIRRSDNITCHAFNSGPEGVDMQPLGGGMYGIVAVIDDLPLLSGSYDLMIVLLHKNLIHVYDYWPGVAPFTVIQQGRRDEGVYKMRHRWE